MPAAPCRRRATGRGRNDLLSCLTGRDRLRYSPRMNETANSAAGVVWDLSDLFRSPEDPRIEETLSAQLARARTFQQRYSGRIDSRELDAATLAGALREYR